MANRMIPATTWIPRTTWIAASRRQNHSPGPRRNSRAPSPHSMRAPNDPTMANPMYLWTSGTARILARPRAERGMHGARRGGGWGGAAPPQCGSDKQLDVRFLHLQQGRCCPDRLLQPRDEVLALQAQQVHGHLAREEPHPNLLGQGQQLLGLGDLVVPGQLSHHGRPGAAEVQLRQL